MYITLLKFIAFFCISVRIPNIYATENKKTDFKQKESEDDTNDQYQEKSASEKEHIAFTRGGFYSGFSLGLNSHELSSRLITKDSPEDKISEVKSNKSNLGVGFSLGYGNNISSFILGAETSVVFNPASSIKHAEKFKIADVKIGAEYLAFAKLGLVCSRFTFFGKVGGIFSNYTYDWKINNLTKDKKENYLSTAYGLGIEFSLMKNISLNTEFLIRSKGDVDKLNVSTNKDKLDSSTGRSWEIKLGCNYRF